MQATWRGETIAASDQTREMHGYRYFPREAVKMEWLTPSPKTASDLECPHGVQFYDIVSERGRSIRAAWSYLKPKPTMQPIDHWIGFWEDVEVR